MADQTSEIINLADYLPDLKGLQDTASSEQPNPSSESGVKVHEPEMLDLNNGR